MTRLRPLVIPVPLTVAPAASSAAAHARRPVFVANPRAILPRPVDLTAVHAAFEPRAASVQAAKSLPLAALANLGEAVNPDGRHAAPATPATAVAAGRPKLQSQR